MLRQSPLLSAYAPNAFEIGAVHDMDVALRARSTEIRADYVADLSALRRRLFVGPNAAKWLAQHRVDAPTGLLEYRDLGSDAVIVRLHRDQYLLIDALDTSPFDELFTLPEGRYDDVVIMAYEAAEIGCGGPHLDTTVAELCPMDVDAVADHVWIATRFAHCEVALRRLHTPHWRIICTPADARHLFAVLRDVTLERGGATIGFEDYRELVKQ